MENGNEIIGEDSTKLLSSVTNESIEEKKRKHDDNDEEQLPNPKHEKIELKMKFEVDEDLSKWPFLQQQSTLLPISILINKKLPEFVVGGFHEQSNENNNIMPTRQTIPELSQLVEIKAYLNKEKIEVSSFPLVELTGPIIKIFDRCVIIAVVKQKSSSTASVFQMDSQYLAILRIESNRIHPWVLHTLTAIPENTKIESYQEKDIIEKQIGFGVELLVMETVVRNYKLQIESDIIADKVYQLRVGLKGSNPEIWRTVEVEGNETLESLHVILNLVMGWANLHPYQFSIRGEEITAENSQINQGHEPTTDLTLSSLAFKPDEWFVYEYDLEDSWMHIVKIENILDKEENVLYPRCAAGERACPPEKCGGVARYQEYFLPQVKNNQELMQWAKTQAGNANVAVVEREGTLQWDPSRFAIDIVNEQLHHLFSDEENGGLDQDIFEEVEGEQVAAE